LYTGKVKTDESRNSIPIPEAIRPVIEAWRKVCKDTSPEALMFSTSGRKGKKGASSAQKLPEVENSPDR
jgi:hypothetical protein